MKREQHTREHIELIEKILNEKEERTDQLIQEKDKRIEEIKESAEARAAQEKVSELRNDLEIAREKIKSLENTANLRKEKIEGLEDLVKRQEDKIEELKEELETAQQNTEEDKEPLDADSLSMDERTEKVLNLLEDQKLKIPVIAKKLYHLDEEPKESTDHYARTQAALDKLKKYDKVESTGDPDYLYYLTDQEDEEEPEEETEPDTEEATITQPLQERVKLQREYLENSRHPKTIRDTARELYNIDDEEFGQSVRSKIYDAFHRTEADTKKVGRTNYYSLGLTEEQFEKFLAIEASKEKYDKVIDGATKYEWVKRAVGKMMPGENRRRELHYHDFTDHFTASDSQVDQQAWVELAQDGKLQKAILYELGIEDETSISFKQESDSSGNIWKGYKMIIDRR